MRPLGESSQDFGYSLGVLYHIPDTQAARGRPGATRRYASGVASQG